MKLLLALTILLTIFVTPVLADEASSQWEDNVEHIESISTINGVALFWIIVFFLIVTTPKIQDRLFPGADDEVRVLNKVKSDATLTEAEMVILANYTQRMKWRYILIIVYLVLIFSASIPGGLF